MYQRTLQIGLFDVDATVEKVLHSVVPPDRIKVHATAPTSFTPADIACCDVAVVGSSVCAPALPGVEADRPFLILYASKQVLETLCEQELAAFDDVWHRSDNPALLALRFQGLLERKKLEADLYLAHAYLNTTIDSIPELVWFKDAQGSHLKVNEAFCKTVQKTKEQVEGRGHYYIWDITPEEYSCGEYVCLESEEETMEAQHTLLFDEQVKTINGMRQFKTYKSPLFDYDGSVMGTVGIAHDVTDLGNIETELDIFIDSMPYAVVVLDMNNIVLNVNGKAEEYFGVQRNVVVGGSFNQWRREVLGDKTIDSYDFSDSSFFTANIQGKEKTFEVNQRYIVDVFNNPTGQLRIYRDITKERALEQQVLKNANTDYLTGLYNRRYLYQLLGSNPPKTTTILSLDLDNFKGVNDTHGHQTGDHVLMETSRILLQEFADATVVRMGGDEFIVVLLGDYSQEQLEQRAASCLEALSDCFKMQPAMGASTASIGIASSHNTNLSTDDLIKRSDDALYQAKRKGKSQFYLWDASLSVEPTQSA